jgi:signal transduction histidine kinase
MKTALLLTNSAETQRLLTEILGEKTNFVLLPPPTDPSRERFDSLFSTWLRLVDAVILDAVSLGETTRWAVESLAMARLQEHQAIVVRATAAQQSLYPMEQGWLVVSDSDSADRLKQSLGTFFELRDAQSKLKRADAVIARQRQTTPKAFGAAVSPAPGLMFSPQAHPSAIVPSFDAYRYRDALKDLSRILSQHLDENELLSEFLRLVQELLGVGKVAIFTRPLQSELFADQLTASGTQFTAARSAGIAQHVVEHLRLSVDSGIGGCLAREAKILRRAQTLDSLALDYDPEIAREFELLGTEVAVPMFDDGQLLAVLTFSGRITGEPLTSEELELVHHLMTQLAQAVRNLHLRDRIASQERFLSEVLAHVQSGVVAVGQDSRILSINRRARALLDLGDEAIVGQDSSRLPSRVGDVIFEVLQTGQEICDREVTLPRSNRPLSISAARFAASLAGMQAAAGNLVTVALIEDLTQAKLQQARERELADKEFFTRLAARLSHELKNSLVSIKIFAQLLPERYNETEFREQFSGVVINEVNRVDVLVNNLTFFSHPLGLVHEEVVLIDVIENCLGNVGQEFARKKLAQVVAVGEKAPEPASGVPVVMVKKTFGHKLTRLEGDKIRLMQAFEHVLRNALQAMPTGGRLMISTSDAQPTDFPDGKLPVGGAVRIEWQDTGEGIALENLKRVVEPFVTTRNVGVGLGLTIVKKIIERHCGRLEIDSMLGRGTTVVMLLPVKAQPHPDDALLSQLVKEEAAAEQGAEHHEAINRLPRAFDQERGERS